MEQPQTDQVRRTAQSNLSDASPRGTEATASSPAVMSHRVPNPRHLTPADIRFLQRSAGNQATLRLLGSQPARHGSPPVKPRVQRALHVGPVKDRHEEEADRVAQRVMRAATTPLKRTTVRRQSLGASAIPFGDGGKLDKQTEHEIHSTRGKGMPLDKGVRTRMEGALQADFSGVRVHADAKADRLSRSLGARAFTTGSDVFFQRGQYSPGSSDGQRLLAHELTHVVQQGGGIRRAPDGAPVIQRAPISPDDLIGALDTIPFIKAKLDDANVRTEVMRDRVKAILSTHQTVFGGSYNDTTNEVMMLAMAIDGIARVIAQELVDPGVQPQIAQALISVYRTELDTALKSKGVANSTETLDAAEVIVRDNPVAKYMHREVRKELAAAKIRAMADEVGVSHDTMFDLLNQRFQSEIASYKRSKIQATQVKREAYNYREAAGEFSDWYFTWLFGNVESPASRQATPTDEGGFTFTADAGNKLQELRQEVLNPTPQRTFAPRDPSMTGKQEQHLTEIEESERNLNMTGVHGDLIRVFVESFYMTEKQARSALAKVIKWLPKAPLTITVEGSRWFSKVPDADAGESQFKPSTTTQKQKGYKDIFNKDVGGTLKYTGKFEHPSAKVVTERTEQYLQFRKWKDNLMTSLLDFAPEEMPTFGAVNVNWKQNKATSKPEFGVNYYGDTHFQLRKAAVRNRLVYTATDHGTPRRDPLLAVHDFAVGGSHTKLKDVMKIDMLGQIVNAAMLGKNLSGDLPFEIQIFGEVDVAKHVEKISIAPSVDDGVKANAKAFCKQHGVGFEILKPTKDQRITTRAQLVLQEQMAAKRISGSEKRKVNKMAGGDDIKKFYLLSYNLLRIDPKTANEQRLIATAYSDLKKHYENRLYDEIRTEDVKTMYAGVQNYVQAQGVTP